MNKKIVFFALIMILSGFIIISYLAGSGRDFYTIFRDDYSSAGNMLYQSNCVKCHGLEGEGVASYPVIKNSKRSKQDIKQLIVHGAGEMPAFPNFSKTELNQLVDYILEL